MKENLLGIDVCNVCYDRMASSLLDNMEEKRKSFVVAVNPIKIMKAQRDEELRQLLNQADYQIPDGMGVIWASKLKKGNIRQRVTGIDLMLRLCKEAAVHGKRVFLYGAKPGIAEQTKEKLEQLCPGLEIVGTQHGYENDKEKIVQTINDAKPDILFVALGSPQQEHWIIQHKNNLHPYVFQGVGGSFDVISGNVKRAPAFFRKNGLEWFYRLVTEPWRLRRQLVLPLFLLKALFDRQAQAAALQGTRSE